MQENTQTNKKTKQLPKRSSVPENVKSGNFLSVNERNTFGFVRN